MKKVHVIFALVCCSTVGLAQEPFEAGVKGGATFTHGYTRIPAVTVPVSASASVTIPQLNNDNNGIGTSYSYGLWARKNYDRFFIQVEADFNSFLLKQQTNLNVPAALAFTIARQPRPSIIPAETPTAVTIISESTLQSINIPILFGRRWVNGKIRGYLGPNLLFTTRAEVRRNTSATIGGATITVPETTTDLKNPNLQNPTEAQLKVKAFTFAGEIGVGYTILNRIDLDARYAVPVGGVYENKAITGYLGIATVTLGYRLF
ncbi:PorT family protein [Fibrisoma montanum]|uniref:PorT family protein n=1 Tax=Fibrisoma montanum TaxID=2305895 RepID=A0A418M075_9BACT|nr:outer membrane beta-barrel protein [Fibrisoma montanum]RIV18995.1 PorT family protein [Fibrisoma montanum]